MIVKLKSTSSSPGTGADIVHDEGPGAVGAGAMGDEADMGEAVGELLGDDIARLVVSGVVADSQSRLTAAEEGLEIGNAAVIDIGVGLAVRPQSAG